MPKAGRCGRCWNLQEGEISSLLAPQRRRAPYTLDTDAPLRADDGGSITDDLWGIYFKQDRHGVRAEPRP